MSILKYQSWESNHFKKNIYRLFDSDFCVKDLYLEIKKNNASLVQSKCSLSKVGFINKHLLSDFKYMSTSIVFSKKIFPDDYVEGEVLLARKGDVSQLRCIAENSFQYSRFNISLYDEKYVEMFYAKWVENSVFGIYDDVCIIIKSNDFILGFLTLKFVKGDTYRVGLFAVHEKSRGRGVGSQLLNNAFLYISRKNGKFLEIETQYENTKAVSFYKKKGFQLKSLAAWLYLVPELK